MRMLSAVPSQFSIAEDSLSISSGAAFMLLHQLLASFQVFLFQRLRLPEKLLSHRLHADQLPSPAIFRDVGSERRVCCRDGVDRTAFRAAEEGMLNIANLSRSPV